MSVRIKLKILTSDFTQMSLNVILSIFQVSYDYKKAKKMLNWILMVYFQKHEKALYKPFFHMDLDHCQLFLNLW